MPDHPTLPTLSVCIVTYNSGDTITECLESVARQRDVNLEAIVVDNASSDDSVTRAAAFPFCRVVANSRNQFFARANNQALAASAAEFVLALNPDTVLDAGAAAAMLAGLRAYPDVGAAICTVVGDRANGTPEVPHWWPRRTVWDLLGSLQPWLWWRERRATTVAAAAEAALAVRDVAVISNACLFGRRAALTAIGGYDERYRLYFTEDDLCHRLQAAGWRVCVLPMARVYHRGGTSVRKAPRVWLRWVTIQDSLAYARQWLGVTAVAAVAAASIADLAVVALARGAKWLVARGQRMRSLHDAA